jgi:hypothetical protein
MAEYLVVKKEKCSQCDGQGVYSPNASEYKEFINASEIKMTEMMEAGTWHTQEGIKEKTDFDDAWWAERGYPGGVNNWPSEEVECDECFGTGFIKSQVSLIDALNEIKANPPSNSDLQKPQAG